MKQKKILVTGASGFVGHHLVLALIAQGFEVIPLDKISSGLPDEVICDLANPSFISELSSLKNIRAIVHLGAQVKLKDTSLEDLYAVNVLATGLLAHWAKKNDVYFLFASTIMTYGKEVKTIRPTSLEAPDTPYAKSKQLGEVLIKSSGVKSCILKIGGIFGANGPTHLGLNNNLCRVMQGLPPELYGKGREKRNYIYAKDLAEIITSCVSNNITGTHLVAGSEICTIAQMLDILCDVFAPKNRPLVYEGTGGNDQIIEPSQILPQGRPFAEAIADIKSQLCSL